MMYKLKRKGTTLIELIVVLGLLSIMSLIGVKGYSLYNNIIYDIEIKQFLYDIEETLSYGKEYCHANRIGGDFYVEKENENLIAIFKCGEGVKRKVELPDSITLVNELGAELNKSTYLTITTEGHIKSESIYFKDEKGEKYVLSVRVGVDFITVKEKEIE